MIPRPELERVPPVSHGGHSSDLPTGDLLDFSANINPSGPSPHIWQAMCAVEIGRHPDPRAAPLRRALAEREQLDPRALLVGNGAVDLIYHLAVAFLRPGDRVLIAAPTFGEYAAAAAVMGAEIINHPGHAATSAAGLRHNVAVLIHAAQQHRPRLLFLCNPNNPTGTYLEREAVEALLHACPDTLLVLDEAFVRFVPAAWSARDLLEYGNLLVLRSMTKDYALTALRVGYAMAAPEIIDALQKVQPPWSVNTLAQAAALAALEDEAHLQTSLAALWQARDRLLHDLAALNWLPEPSAVHFFLLPTGQRSASEVAAWLLARGILVRDCTSFGLPQHIRIAAREPAENSRLAAVLAECKEELCPDVS